MTQAISGLRIRFGADHVTSGIANLEVTDAVNEESRAKADVQVSSIRTTAADFRPIAAILDGDERIFTGWVASVEVEDGTARVSMRNGYQLEGRIDRLVISDGITPPEMAWSIGRMAGFSEQNLHIQGFRRDPDRFHVAMPVRGIAPMGEPRFERVRLTSDMATMRDALSFARDDAWVDELLATGVWAVAPVEAGTLFEAEQAGVELIAGTLDRLAAESQYSLASSPEGSVVSFRRKDLFTDPRAVRTAVVRAATRAGRAWVRTLDPLADPTPLATRRAVLEGPPVGDAPQFDEAIRAWRRSLATEDRVAAATAVSEALEFYAAGGRTALAFSDEEVAALKTALRGAVDREGRPLALTTRQKDRIASVLGMINEPSLKQRLLAAMEADQVPFTRDEVERVWRIRNARNDFVHGRSRGDIDEDDLDLARAFVNRLIFWWGRSARMGHPPS